MEEKDLLPIGTKVYITENSEHYSQGINTDGTKKIGVIIQHMDAKYDNYTYIYRVEWNNNSSDENTYQGCDVEPIEKKKSEEEINNELKQLFNKILNN
jgi:hypothetical protein